MNAISPTLGHKQQLIALKSAEQIRSALLAENQQVFTLSLEGMETAISLPRLSMELIAEVLEQLGSGRQVTVIPRSLEISTQAAADYLNVSRPHVVKLLEEGEIPYRKVGKHRRIEYNDLLTYDRKMRSDRAAVLKQMMAEDEEDGLYESP